MKLREMKKERLYNMANQMKSFIKNDCNWFDLGRDDDYKATIINQIEKLKIRLFKKVFLSGNVELATKAVKVFCEKYNCTSEEALSYLL